MNLEELETHLATEIVIKFESKYVKLSIVK